MKIILIKAKAGYAIPELGWRMISPVLDWLLQSRILPNRLNSSPPPSPISPRPPTNCYTNFPLFATCRTEMIACMKSHSCAKLRAFLSEIISHSYIRTGAPTNCQLYTIVCNQFFWSRFTKLVTASWESTQTRPHFCMFHQLLTDIFCCLSLTHTLSILAFRWSNIHRLELKMLARLSWKVLTNLDCG